MDARATRALVVKAETTIVRTQPLVRVVVAVRPPTARRAPATFEAPHRRGTLLDVYA